MPDLSYIERAVSLANVNALRMALFQATRDPEIQAIPVRRVMTGGFENVVIDPADEALIRRKAVELLASEIAPEARQEISTDELDELVQMAEGRRLSAFDLEMRRLLPSFGAFPHEARWSGGNRAPEGFSVAIIGGGFAGLAMAVQLERLGIPYRVFERRHEVGGVWSINTYPDARVDTLSAIYQFGFEKNYPWTQHFARQSEVRGYLEHIAKRHGVWPNIGFHQDVTEAHFNEDRAQWDLTITTANGSTINHTASVVVTASGLFATPRDLDLPGRDRFEGEVMHTARWGDVDFTGKKVAIVGNGSTGVQLLSSIAAVADQVYVCQRTPQWITPRANYGTPIEDELRWLIGAMPYYWNWNKYVAGMGQTDLREMLLIDDEWIRSGGSVNERNDALRKGLEEYIAAQVGGDRALIEHLVPDYPPMTRRPVVDNGWYAALTRDNVELVPEAVGAFYADGIEMADGRHLEVDIVIAAVGFDAQRYLAPTRYYGRGGVSLEEPWAAEGAKAYLGMTVPGFPNLFMLYGPNSQPVASGNGLPGWFEIWSRYIALALISMIERGDRAIEVRQEIYDEYNALLDKEAGRLIYTAPTSVLKRNYYVNDAGRLQVTVPFTGEELFAMSANPKLSDFHLEPAGTHAEQLAALSSVSQR
ncbi:MAG: FAD-dependent oxidoreductase [Actinomycetota bacterium]